MTPVFVDPTAIVEDGVEIGEGSRIWAHSHVRAGVRIGRDCVVGDAVFIDIEVVMGDGCKIQNAAQIYRGVQLGQGVFVGPAATFTNDLYPRAVRADLTPKSSDDWTVSSTNVGDGASIGANATLLSGITVGSWAMIAAGAVVTRDVADHSLVAGSPARHVGWVCCCGRRTGQPPPKGTSCVH